MTAEKTHSPAQTIAETLDKLIIEAERNERVSFMTLVRAGGLDPARDFVGASLADLDFRDEDLRGFDFSGADLSGADFRRANITRGPVRRRYSDRRYRSDGSITSAKTGMAVKRERKNGTRGTQRAPTITGRCFSCEGDAQPR
jgi:hypothetical protein